MSQEVATKNISMELIETILITGDLSKLTTEQRVHYYKSVCDTVGLNPLTKPFDYINLSGKLTLYARKDATDQLRKLHKVSIRITSREVIGDVYVVTAQAKLPDGREDESTGAVPIMNLRGDNLANAYMKAETKAKRRATLSVCGLGLLDESEVDSIRSTKVYGDQPGENDGIRTNNPNQIQIGQYAGKTFSEILLPDLRRDVERLESLPTISLDQSRYVERAKEWIAAQDQIEVPEEEPELEAEPIPSSRKAPECCGKVMLLSKFPDKKTGKTPHWCTSCKIKIFEKESVE